MKKQLQQKLTKLNGFFVNDAVVDFVIGAIKDGLPDFKAELRADKEAELAKIEAKRAKLLADLDEIK